MHLAKHRLKNLYKETGTHHVSSQWFKEILTFKLKVNKSWTISRPHLYFTCIIGSPYKKFKKTVLMKCIVACSVLRNLNFSLTVTFNSPVQEIFHFMSLPHNLLNVCFGVMRCHDAEHKSFLSTIYLNSTKAVSDLLLKIIVPVNLCHI